MICYVDENGIIVNIIKGDNPTESNHKIAFPWSQLWQEYTTEKPADFAEKEFEESKKAKWEEIKAYRDAEEQSGCPYMGSVLDSDSLSVQRINTAVQAAQVVGESFEVSWTMKDNTVIHMAYADVLGMPAALAVFSNQLHMKAREKRDQINAAQTIEEVEAIAWK